MPDIVPFDSDDSTPDFYIVGKHARMTIKKTAIYLKVSKQSVERYMSNHIDAKIRQRIVEQGFSGKDLNNITGYFATSSHVKKETKEHCINLLIDVGAEGFQARIDRMAGIVPEPETPKLSPSNSEMLLADIKEIFNGIRADLRKSEEKANTYFQLSENYLKSMYQMYPNYFRMQDIKTGLNKFSTLESLLREVSHHLYTNGIQNYYPLSHYLKLEGYNLTTGEKIIVAQEVSGWLKLSGKEMLKKSREYRNSKNLYPECAKSLIDFAVEMVLSER